MRIWHYAIKKNLLFEEKTIIDSGLFDYKSYARIYPDLPKKKLINHYLTIGRKQKRNPNDDFDIDYYIKRYPHVIEYKYHPFVHYILQGKKERLIPKLPETKLLQTQLSDHYTPLHFPQHKNPRISIIIPVYNNWYYNYHCLKYVLENCYNCDYEVIVADDCSSDETKNAQQYVKNITYLRNCKNLGFLQNCNNATKYAQGQYLFFLNSDALIQKQALKILEETLDNDKSIGICGAMLISPMGLVQIVGGFFKKNKLSRIAVDEPFCNEKFKNKLQNLHFISGAAFMIRRKIWNDIGGFDTRYVPAYYEDNDLCLEAIKRNHKVVCNYNAHVVHAHSLSYSNVKNIKRIRKKSRKEFYAKWKNFMIEDN